MVCTVILDLPQNHFELLQIHSLRSSALVFVVLNGGDPYAEKPSKAPLADACLCRAASIRAA